MSTVPGTSVTIIKFVEILFEINLQTWLFAKLTASKNTFKVPLQPSLDNVTKDMSTMILQREVINLNQKQLVGWVLAIAAINWGLVGVLNVNLVELILGAGSVLTKVAYGLIGVVGVYKLYMLTMSKKQFCPGIILKPRTYFVRGFYWSL